MIKLVIFQVVGNAVRQLQYLVTDESCVECYDLFQAESKNNATGGYCGSAADRQIPELLYQKKAEKLLADENCMKVFVVSDAGGHFKKKKSLFTRISLSFSFKYCIYYC